MDVDEGQGNDESRAPTARADPITRGEPSHPLGIVRSCEASVDWSLHEPGGRPDEPEARETGPRQRSGSRWWRDHEPGGEPELGEHGRDNQP